MDGFLGTAIQYSEQQIKLLEEEYATNQQKIVDELIESGFLDSDVDETTEAELSDFEFERDVLDVNDDGGYSLSESASSTCSPECDESTVSLSSSLRPLAQEEKQIAVEQEEEEEEEEQLQLQPYDEDDEKWNEEDEKEDDEEEQERQRAACVSGLLEYLFADIKYLMFLILIMFALPPPSMHQTSSSRDATECDLDFNCDVLGRVRGAAADHSSFDHLTCVHWTMTMKMHPVTATSTRCSNLEQEQEEEGEGDEESNDCEVVMSAAPRPRRVYLIYGQPSQQQQQQSSEAIRITSYSVPFAHVGSGSPHILRIFKETMPSTMRRQFGSTTTQSITTLILAFVGITAFTAASGGFGDLMVSS